MTDDHSVTEGGRDYGAFIPSSIDDYGLDPYEFRIYCRLERRIGKGSVGCFESVASMARHCQMSQQKVRNALKVLVLAGIAKQEKLPGKTDRYILMPPAHWVNPHSLALIRQQVTAYRQESDRKTVAKRKIKQDEPHYDVADTLLQRSNLPRYDVVDTQLRRSDPPNYDVADTPLRRSDKGIPIKAIHLRYSNEGEATAAKISPQVGESEVEILNSIRSEQSELVGFQAEAIHDHSFTFWEQHQNAREETKDTSRGKSSTAVEEEIQRQIQRLAFDWRSRPWMLNATEFQPEMKLAVWRSNPQEYSIAGLDVPNETYICNHLRKLNERLKNPHEAYAAIVKLQTYWRTAQALVNPDIQQQFSAFKVAAKQSSLQSHLAERQQHTLEAIKDLL